MENCRQDGNLGDVFLIYNSVQEEVSIIICYYYDLQYSCFIFNLGFFEVERMVVQS